MSNLEIINAKAEELFADLKPLLPTLSDKEMTERVEKAVKTSLKLAFVAGQVAQLKEDNTRIKNLITS